MPNEIDPSSLNFNEDGGGFRFSFLPVNPDDEPEVCNLPPLTPIGEFDLNEDLTTPAQVCKFEFDVTLPPTPVFIPKIQPPVIECPAGVTFSGEGTITGTGGVSAGGSLKIIEDPDASCAYKIVGDFVVDAPEIACPDGISVTNDTIMLRGSGALEGAVFISLTGGPCGLALSTVGQFYVAPIPPPGGGGGGGGGGGSIQGDCVNCPGSCTEIAAAIEDAYADLASIPVVGDQIDLCSFIYEVAGPPDPLETCPEIDIVSFIVEGITYFARQLRNECWDSLFMVGASIDATPTYTEASSTLTSLYEDSNLNAHYGDVIKLGSYVYQVVNNSVFSEANTDPLPNIVNFTDESTATHTAVLIEKPQTVEHPFRLILNDDETQCKVFSGSKLFNLMIDGGGEVTITNLNTFLTFANNDDIYLEGTTDGEWAVTGGEIKIGTMGDPVVFTGSDPDEIQTTFRILIGKIDTSLPNKVIQNIHNHLRAHFDTQDSYALIYAD